MVKAEWTRGRETLGGRVLLRKKETGKRKGKMRKSSLRKRTVRKTIKSFHNTKRHRHILTLQVLTHTYTDSHTLRQQKHHRLGGGEGGGKEKG
jgi:hypothetical protein